jgi:hypothetical protein
MNVRLPSCQSEPRLRLNTVRAYGTPVPQQGEGEGEGLFEATGMDSKTPHLHPLPFSEGRGEKGQVGSGAKLTGHNVDGGDFALVKPAINKCWRQ